MEKLLDIFKQLQAVVALVLPYIAQNQAQETFPFINPVIVEQMWKLSAIFSVIASSAGYNRSCFSPRTGVVLSVVGLVLALIAVGVMLTVTGELVQMSGSAENVLIRGALVTMFTGLGLVVGCAFSRLIPPSRAHT